MKYLTVGRTDLTVSEFGFGCISIIPLSQDDAVKVLRHAFDRGITFFDTANAYRDSEEKIGIAFAGMRHKVVLASKTLMRGAEGALEHLENSLRQLRTDHVDLFQLNQISREQDWHEVTGPAGALEALIKAKTAGKVRYIGVTSHNLQMSQKMVNSGYFDTIQFPFNLLEEGAKDELIGASQDMGMGFIGMKPLGGGVIDNTVVAFKYLRDNPGVIPIPGFKSCDQVDEVIACYAEDNVITEQEYKIMETYRRILGKKFCRRCEHCQPCPQGVLITPAIGYPIVASQISAALAVESCKKAMESTLLCTGCGACSERCPYDLQVSDIMKANNALFEKHCQDNYPDQEG